MRVRPERNDTALSVRACACPAYVKQAHKGRGAAGQIGIGGEWVRLHLPLGLGLGLGWGRH